MSEYFTEAEARALVGRRFQANPRGPGYNAVPPGTRGTVTGTYRVGPAAYGVDVTWDGLLTDGFSRGDLEARFNRDVPGCGGELAMLPLDAAPVVLVEGAALAVLRPRDQRAAPSSSCHRCHRALKNPKARQRGYGAVCWRKVQAEDAQLEADFRRAMAKTEAASAAAARATEDYINRTVLNDTDYRLELRPGPPFESLEPVLQVSKAQRDALMDLANPLGGARERKSQGPEA